MKELFLLRGLPGSGKSTLAKSLGGKNFEADMFFMNNGVYEFDVTKLPNAHRWCRNCVERKMEDLDERIVVSNTFTQEWEMKEYEDLAKEHGYIVYYLIVENRHDGVNSHNVPTEVIEKMRKRFTIKL
jgi:predicted kinase|tara:strand:+ start:77 stop:460 length:384 start_codon:yes stop_codon:yes gene_type:complete